MHKKIYLKARQTCPRLDRFLAEHLPNLSRHQIEKMIQAGQVTVNGRTAQRKNLALIVGDRVEVNVERREEAPYRPSIGLAKLFEDEWLLVIDKPAGIAVHPGAGAREETILDVFRFHYPEIERMAEKERPGLVHRLDKETSGVLLLAKDEPAMRNLQKQFKRRAVRKEYLTLVNGRVERRCGRIDQPIGRDLRQRIKFRALPQSNRDDLKEALTDYELVCAWPRYSLLRVIPLTGRTHQIRVHLAAIGHPVAGDTLYGGRRDKSFPRLALHAHILEFTHPRTRNTVYAVSPFPAELRRIVASLFSRG